MCRFEQTCNWGLIWFVAGRKQVEIGLHICGVICLLGESKLKEGKMMRQMSFKLTENEELHWIWDRLPETNQKEIKRLYAKLIAQVAKSELRSEAKEKGGSDVEQ